MLKRIAFLALATLVLVGTVAEQVMAGADKYSVNLERTLESGGATAQVPLRVWVRFSDKGLDGAQRTAALTEAESRLSEGALARRAKVLAGGPLVDEADLPVAPAYKNAVAATGAVLRHESRWLNAVSCEVTAEQLSAISELPFVQSLEPVARKSRTYEPPTEQVPTADSAGKSFDELDYGASIDALELIGVPELHADGLSGEGVIIGVFDTGFELEHECFRDLDVIAAWDFVDMDSEVGWQPGDHDYQAMYGTADLSALAGFSRSNLIGVAYGASVILAKTEDIADESPAEEDNWIAALEWSELMGVDVISSQVGYIDWYAPSDLDGMTCAITVAAEMASARGVVVVTSAGDQRGSPTWNHVIAPADGHSVIAVGSCDNDGLLTPVSSPGPTADGRIKPDVLAPGWGTVVAFDLVENMYFQGYGTNYATPLAAGVVALMLERNPRLSPTDVADALRNSASRNTTPDNDYGYGVIDAVAAMQEFAPAIVHTPLGNTEGGTGSYDLVAVIASGADLDPNRTWISWRVAGGNWQLRTLTNTGGAVWTGSIPAQPADRDIEYYLVATDVDGQATRHPAAAPGLVHGFHVGPDTEPPVIDHLPLANQVPSVWPPLVHAVITDNLGVGNVQMFFNVDGGADQGPFPMVQDGDRWELEFPIPAEAVNPGFHIAYGIAATDVATGTNITLDGMHEFDVVVSKGSILLVDDRSGSKSAEKESAPARGPVVVTEADPAKSATDLAGWLTDAGYTVETAGADNVTLADFLGHDVVMVTSGGNFGPLSFSELRRAMVQWVELGGRIVVEGGEVAYAVAITGGYTEIAEQVLHIDSYAGEDGAILRPPSHLADHPLSNRPHELPRPFVVDNSGGGDYGAADLAVRATDAFCALQTPYGTDLGGVIAYDNNSGPDAGMSIFLPFDLMKTNEADGRLLLDNVMTWLTAVEAPGTGAIAGRVILAGQEDHGGTVVSIGVDQQTTTAADGTYTLSGLWGGSYRVTVTAEGYAPATRVITAQDDVTVSGNDFYLMPVTEVALDAAPGLPIPDNNPDGVSSTLTMPVAGNVQAVSVDIDISHYSVGHLVVTLTSPDGTVVTLRNRTGETNDDLVGNWTATLAVDGPGEMKDFTGDEAAGDWTIHVSDHVFGATGTFNTWGLTLLVTEPGLSSTDTTLPAPTRLLGNAPNPFNPRTGIAFELARDSRVQLEVYDLRGRLVRRLADGPFARGLHTVTWDGRNGAGAQSATGIYFCRLRADGAEQVHKMTLMK